MNNQRSLTDSDIEKLKELYQITNRVLDGTANIDSLDDWSMENFVDDLHKEIEDCHWDLYEILTNEGAI